MRAIFFLLQAGLLLGACNPDKSTTGEEEGDTDTDTDSDTDSDTDTDTDTDTDSDVYLEPAAIGIELRSGYSTTDGLIYYAYDNGDGTIDDAYGPYLTLTVTDIDYFSIEDDEERADHFCEFYASFPHIVHEVPPPGYGYDYDAGGGGGTGETYSLDFFAEGRADIYLVGYQVDDSGQPVYDDNDELVPTPACQSLIEQGYPDVIDGMHVGLGIGDMTPYLEENTETGWEGYEESLYGYFVAINHPSDTEEEGYDFLAYDWGVGVSFEATVNDFEFTTTDGETIVLPVAVAAITEDGTSFVPGFTGEDAYLVTQAFWYEDYPYIDLSILQEGVPELPEE